MVHSLFKDRCDKSFSLNHRVERKSNIIFKAKTVYLDLRIHVQEIVSKARRHKIIIECKDRHQTKFYSF